MPKSFQEGYFVDDIMCWEGGKPVYWEPVEEVGAEDEGEVGAGREGGEEWMEEVLREVFAETEIEVLGERMQGLEMRDGDGYGEEGGEEGSCA